MSTGNTFFIRDDLAGVLKAASRFTLSIEPDNDNANPNAVISRQKGVSCEIAQLYLGGSGTGAF
jgi:hypothetical protein